MHQIKNILMFLVCSFGLMTSQFANASIITTNCVAASECTLDELVNDSGEIQIGGVTFDNWSELDNFITTGGPLDELIDLSKITISGIDYLATGNPDEYTLGLKLSFEPTLTLTLDSADSEKELNLHFDFLVNTIIGTDVIGADLVLGERNVPLSGDSGYVEANLDSGSLLSLQVYEESNGASLTSVTNIGDTFSSTSSEVFNSLIQMGVFDSSNPVSLTSYTMMFTVNSQFVPPVPNPVPEPSSAAVMLLGLLILLKAKFQRSRLEKA